MKKCITGVPVFLLLGFFVLSCDILRDSPFEVEAWTPGEGYHSRPGAVTVSLLFSHESDHAKTEEAFSLTRDSSLVKGLFSWDGRRLVFRPLSPLEPNRDYRITVETTAQDRRGLSLDRKFEALFTTRPPGIRPEVNSVEPGWDGVLSENRGIVRIGFSEPVTINSCIAGISFSPSSGGSWRLEDDGRTACFTPSEPWKTGSRYTLKIAADFSDAFGRTLGEDFLSRFSVGSDQEKPFLIHAWVLDPSGNLELNGEGEFGEWESFHKLELEFSEPVDTGSVRSRLVTEPSANLLMETPPGLSSRVTFCFTEKPLWGEPFLFRLSSGAADEAGNESAEEHIFRIRASGPLSRPPVLVGIRLPLAPGKSDPDEQEPVSFTGEDLFEGLDITNEEGHFPYEEEIPVWIEFYFDTAPGTSINPYSLMDLFRLESTANALYFSPRSVRDSDFSRAEKQKGWENYERLEIRGYLINRINSGIVTFHIGGGLEDKRGNSSPGAFRISLLK